MPSGGYDGSYDGYGSGGGTNSSYVGVASYRSYYNQTYDSYGFKQTYEGSDYQNTSYYTLIQNNYGSTYTEYYYNSGRLQGYLFVGFLVQNYDQAGVGDYTHYAYYAHSEGYYGAQPGQQGVFYGSTYYANAVYSPYG